MSFLAARLSRCWWDLRASSGTRSVAIAVAVAVAVAHARGKTGGRGGREQPRNRHPNRATNTILLMPKPPRDPDTLIARVREIALSLPDATEKLSHGEPAFFVRGRLFATMDNNHHGSGHVAIWCNAPPG